MDVYGRIVRLRALEPEDMEKLRGYHNDPEVAALLAGWSFPISSPEQRRWYDSTASNKTSLRLAIDVPGTGFVGISTLAPIDWKDRRAFHGIMIGEKELRGKGIGRDATMATMRYAFDELQLHRLDGEILEGHEASIRLWCGRCGWVREGTRRQHAYRSGRYLDRILVGITREEYQLLIVKTSYWTAPHEPPSP